MVPDLVKTLIEEFYLRTEKSENKRDNYPRYIHVSLWTKCNRQSKICLFNFLLSGQGCS